MADILSQEDIDNLLATISRPEDEANDKKNADSPVANIGKRKRVRLYDFKRPDKFSKEQIRTLTIMHETFARLCTTTLSAQLRSLVNVYVASVDQLTYDEFIRSIPSPTMLSIVNMDPLKGSALLEIDSALTFSIVELLLGGEGNPLTEIRELTEIEQAVQEGVLVRILGNMRESWSQVVDLRPRLGRIETNPQFAQLVPPSEIVVLITLGTRIEGVEGVINFCIPYLTLEPIISNFSAQYWYSNVKQNSTSEDISHIRENMLDMEVPITAEIGNMSVNLRDIVNLKPHDFLRIYTKKINEDLIIKVGDEPKYLARPGVLPGKSGKIGVQITEIYKSDRDSSASMSDLDDEMLEEI